MVGQSVSLRLASPDGITFFYTMVTEDRETSSPPQKRSRGSRGGGGGGGGGCVRDEAEGRGAMPCNLGISSLRGRM
ncbi:hypothetical protein HZH66_009999 [Vespula vulgaris]|uniref:Uncharacterized protein n=1 Tax=Vespula vulgaris TaxID=7454 RepID=A0A834MXL3_VESVU|nr:hypothetical protein HZH66_009999 [Vespula vulgaris]